VVGCGQGRAQGCRQCSIGQSSTRLDRAALDWAVLDGQLAAMTAVQHLPGIPVGGRGDGEYDCHGAWGDAHRSASLQSHCNEVHTGCLAAECPQL